MEVFEFDKTLMERVEEISKVLCFSDEPIPTSKVRTTWAYFIEVQIEPLGWQALWRIPRIVCEEMGIRYPTVVYGNVENIIFSEMNAEFSVIAVQDDDIDLVFETHRVPIEQLWPTKKQENSALNIEKTADCIDALRFFYNHIWMPWDKDDDENLDYFSNVISRIQFYCDLKNHQMKRSTAAHIKMLLEEARYIISHRESLETDLSDDEDENQRDKKDVKNLLKLHMRLNLIKWEIEMLENPHMRKIYEENNFSGIQTGKIWKNLDKLGKPEKCEIFIVTKPDLLAEQVDFLTNIIKIVGNDKVVQTCSSLQDALNSSNSSDQIFIPTGEHPIKFLAYLNNNGSIRSIAATEGNLKKKLENDYTTNPCQNAVIMSQNEDSVLIVCDGNFLFENVTFDCRNVRTGVVLRDGANVTFKNCILIGIGASITQQGFSLMGKSSLHLEDTIILDFGSALIMKSNSKLSVKNCIISKCHYGIEFSDKCDIVLEDLEIENCDKYGIYFETFVSTDGDKKIIYDKIDDIPNIPEMKIKGTCSSNLMIRNRKFGSLEDPASLIIDEEPMTIVD